MSTVRRYFELAVDVCMFAAACAFLINGFLYLMKNQRALQNVFVEKGTAVVSEVFPDTTVSGEEIVAFCLYPVGAESVVLDGNNFDISSLKSMIPYIDFENRYVVTRIHTETGMSLDIKTVTP